MTLEVFNHLKSHKETADFISKIGFDICDKTTCDKCPMVLDAKLSSKGITSTCACALIDIESMNESDIEMVKVIERLLDLFN